VPFLERALARHEESEAEFIVNWPPDALIDFLRTLWLCEGRHSRLPSPISDWRAFRLATSHSRGLCIIGRRGQSYSTRKCLLIVSKRTQRLWCRYNGCHAIVWF